MIYWQLYWIFIKVGLFCIGGGYASMPLIEEQVVYQQQWISMKEFVDIFTISQMTPGPIGINAATFVGNKIAGIGGAICATLGFVTPSIIIVFLLAKIYFKYGQVSAIQGILNGIRPAVVSLISLSGIGFFFLAIWDKERIEDVVLNQADPKSILILVIIALLSRFTNLGSIKLLLSSGLLGLIIYTIKI